MKENDGNYFRIGFLVFSIVSFLLVVVGASFAYFQVSEANLASAASIANANITLPKGCTFVATPSASCSITGQTGTTVNYADSIITTAEMTSEHANNVVAISNCTLNVVVSGDKGCYCSYAIKLEKDSFGTTYSPTVSGTNEFTATIKKGSYTRLSETNISNGYLLEDSLSVSSTSPVNDLYSMSIKFYNINANQGALSGKIYSYRLRAYAKNCNGKTV